MFFQAKHLHTNRKSTNFKQIRLDEHSLTSDRIDGFRQLNAQTIEDHRSSLLRFPFDFLVADPIAEFRVRLQPVVQRLTLNDECLRHLTATQNDLCPINAFVRLRSEFHRRCVMILRSVTNRRRGEKRIFPTNEREDEGWGG